MRIFNVMMSRGLGGIEQSFSDYSKALTLENHQLYNITSFGAKINDVTPHFMRLPNLFSWCWFSKIYLKILIYIYKPDIIIAHGNRAINFAIAFKPKNIPLIGVAHNYSYKYLKLCDYIIVITEYLKKYINSNGVDESRICLIPNMIEVKQPYLTKEFRDPVVIGTFGRFVAKKGFEVYIKAISILKNKGINVKALIGGDGPEAFNLKKIVKENNLEETISFLGWIRDKDDFFNKIDIFCLPSLEEPFGIVLLEAMQYSTPIVSSRSHGPSEILRDRVDALLYKVGSVDDLAASINELINNPSFAAGLSSSAYLRLTENYDIKIVSKKLSEFINKIVNTHEL